MTVIPFDEVEAINEIIEYMISHPAEPVRSIKRRFELKDDEYNMVAELMMPAVRQHNTVWQLKHEINKIMKEKGNEDVRDKSHTTFHRVRDLPVRGLPVRPEV